MSANQQKLTSHKLFKTGFYVGGKWQEAKETFDVLNPATGEVVAKVAKAGKAETNAAIKAASDALPAWRKKTGKARSEILHRWYELMIENKQFLGELMVAEQGKPLKEALGEVEYAASYLQWFSEEAKRANGEIIPPVKEGSRIFATREPIGVVAAITPWNFPLAMLTRKLGPALAAGCTGLIKPANNTPLSAFALLELAHLAGVPDGVINGVAGDTHAISDAIMASNEVRKISFTGSTEVGKTLVRNSADTMKKVSMELGGNAPYIVFDDADLDAAVKGAVSCKFRNSGQVCVCINRIYVQDGVYDKFVTALAEEVRKLKVGNGMDDGVIVGPLVDIKGLEKVEDHVKDALEKGGRLVAGGQRHELGGNFYQPTVIADANDDMKVAADETFGPLAACFHFKTEEEVIERANATPFGLAAYFYTQNLQRVFRVAEAIESGMIGINESALSTEVAPFGGVKESGLGREGSVLGLEEYLQVKTLHLGNL
ncbi:MAG: NAD-dependent succinate-semialdehyde dehydrogenase [Ewingella americana]|jgi:succinate-semialdehyde dehydrogenase/glutarate-semialdehyde dehydrogenase|uniref:NAD-dependent succinate-semialdehyde dehydrogenase n=1 Tax=Ewingella americana TaxID=41202 RepID=UPI00242CAA70|nr:NAD-dependent succinate-semialdehyde dehydrogenase [Ewingella americana]MCI1677979.1 NAD-dependent succinate-semialdehyde dehydrogenase [Ewingella americana]MCI1855867.1 NAD-dependent succinate-semialdehyde dehydrogenase [Ewingella americana]MCI1863353.1 NAD-dependent succinate-semialdehyde dehydrogenase [Ewingella americana]MCI2141173.1 NAD-dependent succinate-semialdehyde dehydrogenase [Ewingella americana]MCI2164077.1 NAD-dependent succinate-semialdehyde dehydrogenase [Ewingella american